MKPGCVFVVLFRYIETMSRIVFHEKTPRREFFSNALTTVVDVVLFANQTFFVPQSADRA